MKWGALTAGALMLGALAAWALLMPGPEHEIAAYTTSFEGRTRSQIHNATLAAGGINNMVLMPGDTFSFLKAVGDWTADRGYVKAPVSHDGELVRSWGGGVCQVSTTLYNAALLAGLQIVERHPHHWPARYAPLGRDAAVAYSDIDLKFRNNLPEPIRIVCSTDGESLRFRILSRYMPKQRAIVETVVESVTKPGEVIQDRASGNGRWRLVNRGHPGFCVATYRRLESSRGARLELVSVDRYPEMHRIVRIAER